MEGFILLLVAFGAVAIGSALGYFARQTIAKAQLGSIETKIEKLLADGKTEAQNIIVAAKERAVKATEEARKEEKERLLQLGRNEEKILKREELIDRRLSEYERKESELLQKVDKVRIIKDEVEKLKEEQLLKLQQVASISKDEAKNQIFKLVEEQSKEDIWGRIKKLEKEGQGEIEKKARDLLLIAMQRYSGSQVAESSTSSVSLPSEDMKGRIIGKEGRNIKTLEKITGVEFIIDETPDAITISCFDPVRRQVAKLTLEKLLADGRIQPARIEELYEKAKEEVGQKIYEAGEAAIYELGMVGIDQKLISLLGRLQYRTSYGQNVLQHSVEAAHISGILAEELKVDVKVAKMGALFHDIGKAVDHEIEGSHVEIGRKILQKFNVQEAVIKAMQSHHEDYPYETIESVIVQVAESMSAARPGARKGTLENYIKRLEDLEKIANSFEGVEKSYAISAGREVRIFVSPEKIDDLQARNLAREIANRISQEMQFPGEIKVNVIREMRTIEFAK